MYNVALRNTYGIWHNYYIVCFKIEQGKDKFEGIHKKIKNKRMVKTPMFQSVNHIVLLIGRHSLLVKMRVPSFFIS